MKLKRYYSDINGFRINKANHNEPSMAEVKLAIANGKIIKPEYSLFVVGQTLEVKAVIGDVGSLSRNVYRDLYSIIN